MNKEELLSNKDLNSIKLIRGQRGSYGWEVKLVGEKDSDILERLKKVDTELNQVYNLNLEGGNK